MNKTYQLIEWLLGERKEFPFMRDEDKPEIPMPDTRSLIERRQDNA